MADLRAVHDSLLILRVRPDADIPPHVGGQFTVIGLGVWEPLAEGCVDRVSAAVPPDKLIKRPYSLSTSFFGPNDELLGRENADYLEFYVVLVREDDPSVPSLTGRIFALGPGRRLWVHDRIVGDYTAECVGPEDAVLFLATGAGEAPHNSMLLDLLRGGHRGPITSVACVRRRADLGYLEEHRRLEERWPRYRYVTLTTREADLPRERIQNLLESDALEERIGFSLDPARTHVFVCGNPGMVGAPRGGRGERPTYPIPGGVIEMLARRGFIPDARGRRGNVHYEAFW